MHIQRIAVVSPLAKKRVETVLKKECFQVVSHRPDAVVVFGGDGSILHSEFLYPGVPKLGVRLSERCNKCTARFVGKHAEELVCWSCLETGLDALKQGCVRVKEYTKVEAHTRGKCLIGLNEVQLHHADPTKALRFEVRVDGTWCHAIADGLVMATPFGATGYFQSISRKTFSKGFGLALNNNVEEKEPLFFAGGKAHIAIQRGKGWVVADNQKRKVIVGVGDNIVFQPSNQKARFILL